MKTLSLILLLCSPVKAALPDLITDPATRDTVEYLDAKVSDAISKVSALGSSTVSTSTILGVPNGGTGATTVIDARSNLGVPATDGTGAIGTWPISISGSAASATDSTKVLKSGDTMTGNLIVGASVQANVLLGDGSGITGIPVKDALAFYLHSTTGPVSTNYYGLSSSYSLTGESYIRYPLTSPGENSLGFWVSDTHFSDGDIIVPGDWELHFCGLVSNGSTRDVDVYADISVMNDIGSLSFIKRTDIARISHSSECYSVSFSTGYIPLHNGEGLYGGDRLFVNLISSQSGTGISPDLNVLFGDSWWSHLRIPVFGDNSKYIPYVGAQQNVNLGSKDLTVGGTIIANGINAGTVNATSVGNSLTTYSGDGSGLSNVASLPGNNYWTGSNEFIYGPKFDSRITATEIQLTSATPSIRPGGPVIITDTGGNTTGKFKSTHVEF